jgi:hypothetical protein
MFEVVSFAVTLTKIELVFCKLPFAGVGDVKLIHGKTVSIAETISNPRTSANPKIKRVDHFMSKV